MKKICIQTLTHNSKERPEALEYTLKTFYDSYHGPIIDWFLFFNGYNEEFSKVIDKAKLIYQDKFKFICEISEINLGVGVGLNRLNKITEDYEYTFLLEGDWVTLPNTMSGHSNDWFWNSVKLLDENQDIDHIQFRKYMDEVDDRQYGYHYWVDNRNVEKLEDNGDKFLILRHREYGNNPSMRRMSSFYEKKVLPLKEYYSQDGEPLELKGNNEWGMAEIEATRVQNLKCSWIFLGKFVHFEFWTYKDKFDEWLNDNFGCNKYELPGLNACKYGYLFPNHYFCSMCKKSETLADLHGHNVRYETEILPLQHKEVDHEIILKKIKEINDDPVIDLDNDIDTKRFLNNRLNRGR
jgi:Zn-finger protein